MLGGLFESQVPFSIMDYEVIIEKLFVGQQLWVK